MNGEEGFGHGGFRVCAPPGDVQANRVDGLPKPSEEIACALPASGSTGPNPDQDLGLLGGGEGGDAARSHRPAPSKSPRSRASRSARGTVTWRR